MSGRRNQIEEIPRKDGSVFVRGNLKDKKLIFKAVVEWLSDSSLREEQADNIADFFDFDGYALLTLDSKPEWSYYVFLNDGIYIPEKADVNQEFSFVFMAKPYQFETIETIQQIASSGIVINNGTIEVSPLLMISLSGSVSNLTITNLTMNENCIISGVIAGGSVLELDGGYEAVKVAKLDGLNCLARISGSWLKLAPGENRVQVSNSNANVSFVYRGMKK